MTEEAQATEGVENADVVTEGGDPLLQEDGGRPEWLPEKFNSPEDLATGYSNLEQKLGQKDEEVRNAVMKEIEETAFADRPESVGDYQLPEGFDMEQADGNELLQWWAETSFENGYSNEEFQKGVSMYMDALNANVPDYDAELSKLGDNATARTEAVSLFANQFFAEEHLGAIERMCETADGVLALEHIMENMRLPPELCLVNRPIINGRRASLTGQSPPSLRKRQPDGTGYNIFASLKDGIWVKRVIFAHTKTSLIKARTGQAK